MLRAAVGLVVLLALALAGVVSMLATAIGNAAIGKWSEMALGVLVPATLIAVGAIIDRVMRGARRRRDRSRAESQR